MRLSGKVSTLLVSDLVESREKGERHCVAAVAFMVAGGGFERPTFGLCDLTDLSMRGGLYFHPRGVLATHSLRLPPPVGGLGPRLLCPPRTFGTPASDAAS